MQCRTGDLAIVVNDIEHPRNNGALLRIVCSAKSRFPSTPYDWLCEPLSTFHFAVTISPGMPCVILYRDQELKPLRDSDGHDETLSWLTTPAALQPV